MLKLISDVVICEVKMTTVQCKLLVSIPYLLWHTRSTFFSITAFFDSIWSSLAKVMEEKIEFPGRPTFCWDSPLEQ